MDNGIHLLLEGNRQPFPRAPQTTQPSSWEWGGCAVSGELAVGSTTGNGAAPFPPTAAKQLNLCYPRFSRHMAQVKHSFKHFAVLYCDIDLKTTQQTMTSLFVPCKSQQAVQPWAPDNGRSRGSSSALADQGLCLEHQRFWVFNPISAHSKPCSAWELWRNQLQYG